LFNQPLIPIRKPLVQSARQPKFNFWQSLGTVLSVAVLIATLFTIWTPSSLFSNRLTKSMSQALENRDNPRGNWVTPTSPPTLHIGIVAGHWGKDDGFTCADGLTEGDVNLTIATIVRQKLMEQGYTVDLLKEFDPKLQQYSGIALISIHNDSCDYIDNDSTGFKIAPTLFALSQPEPAARLVSCIADRYPKSTGLKLYNSVTNDMTTYHPFEEISSGTPSVVIETGFLNLDREILTKTPEKPAQGIVDGILCYLRNQPIGSETDNTP
jgi:N-acetylmuramoyl-L-alanine amidase